MSGGYTFAGTTLVLSFVDPRFDGLEVKVASVPTGVMVELDHLTDEATWTGLTRETQKPWVGRLFELLAEYLVEWNLTDRKGAPVPTTVEAMWLQEWALMRPIIWAWRRALVEVPAPLPQPSGDGEQSVEESIPMDVLSPSPPN